MTQGEGIFLLVSQPATKLVIRNAFLFYCIFCEPGFDKSFLPSELLMSPPII